MPRQSVGHRWGPPIAGASLQNLNCSVTPGLCGLHAGAWEVFLEQVTGLKDAVKAAREQLRALSRGVSCAQAQTEKTCIQLADLDTVLESSEEEILQAATVLKFLVPQGPLRTTCPGLTVGIWWPEVCLFGEVQFPHVQNGGHIVSLLLTQWATVYIEQGMFQADSECPSNGWWVSFLLFPHSGALFTGC